MKNIKSYLGLSALVIINVMAYNLTKNNLLGLEPIFISTFSLFLATLVIWSLHFLLQRKIKPDFKKLLTIGLGGIFGIAGFYFYISMALETMGLEVALFYMSGIPLMTLVVALLIGKKTRFRNIFWVFFALVGVVLIYFPMLRSMMFMPKAIGAMLLANLCFVFYTLFNEKMALKYNLGEIITLQVTTGTIVLVMSFIGNTETLAYNLKDLTTILMDLKIVASILFQVIFAIAIGYYLYIYALKRVGAVMSTLFINLIPVIHLLYKLFLDDNQLRFPGILGSLMILVSIYMIEDI